MTVSPIGETPCTPILQNYPMQAGPGVRAAHLRARGAGAENMTFSSFTSQVKNGKSAELRAEKRRKFAELRTKKKGFHLRAGVGVAVVATQKRGKNARSRITVSFCITYIIPNVTGYPFWVGRFTLKYGRFWG